MKASKWFSTIAGAVVCLGVVSSSARAQDGQAQAVPDMQLPPGWTMEDMQACMVAATPTEKHEYLVEAAGVWHGKNTMWMFPGAEPVQTESKSTVTPMLDGRFVKVDITGEMPGMGPYNGFAVHGYDNVSGEFVGTWIDNCGTGMAVGKGNLSSDGKVMTWTFEYNCPMTKKVASLRQIETVTGPDSRTMEIIGADPKSGKEWKMMKIEMTRKTPGSASISGSR